MRQRSSNGIPSYTGLYSELSEILFEISTAEARLWLLRSMISDNLLTRDVLSFVNNQANLRVVNKERDQITIKAAMNAMLVDTEDSLNKLKLRFKTLKTTLLAEVGGRYFKMNRILNKLMKKPRKNKKKKMEQYRRKLDHYRKTQPSYSEQVTPELGQPRLDYIPCEASKNWRHKYEAPKRLQSYKNLSIFRPLD